MAEDKLDKELKDEDSKANDPEDKNPRREKFKQQHSDEPLPGGREPKGTPPGGDDQGPPPDRGGGMKEPTDNTSPTKKP